MDLAPSGHFPFHSPRFNLHVKLQKLPTYCPISPTCESLPFPPVEPQRGLWWGVERFGINLTPSLIFDSSPAKGGYFGRLPDSNFLTNLIWSILLKNCHINLCKMQHGIMHNSGHNEVFFTWHFVLINLTWAQFIFVFVWLASSGRPFSKAFFFGIVQIEEQGSPEE